MHLTGHSAIDTLTNKFSSLFTNKISLIHSSFSSHSCSSVLIPPDTRKILQNLTCVTNDEVRRLVLLSPGKISDLDPTPNSLGKNCIDILVPPITSEVNLSVSEDSFPSHFMSALVSLPLKQPTLDKYNMKVYWPVSNLRFLPNALEKVVTSRLNA